MYLPSLNDEELLRYADSTQNAITSTDLEVELTKRLAALLDNQDDDRLAPLDKIGASAEDVRAIVDALIENCTTSAAMLKTINDHGIDDLEDLKSALRSAREFGEFMDTNADAVTSLHELITSLTH